MKSKKRKGSSLIELFVGLAGAVSLSLMLCHLIVFIMQYIKVSHQKDSELDALLVIDSLKRDLISAVPALSISQQGVFCLHVLDSKKRPIEKFIKWGCNESGLFRKEGNFDRKKDSFYANSTIMMRCPITSLSISFSDGKRALCSINYTIRGNQYQTNTYILNKIF